MFREECPKLRVSSLLINFCSFFIHNLPRCQIGVLAGLLSTSHFRLTDIPSTIGIPKPGKRVIANDGVSETGIKQLVSMPQRQCNLMCLWSHRNIKKKKHKCYLNTVTQQTDRIKITFNIILSRLCSI